MKVRRKLWKKLKPFREKAKKIEFIYKPYKKIVTTHAQKKRSKFFKKRGMDLVMEVERIMEKTPAFYFVDAGTLLGLVRDGKLISWDLDIDFGIFANEKYSWLDLERTLGEAGFELIHQFKFRERIAEQTYQRKNVSIDFFGHYSDDNNSYFSSFYIKQGFAYKDDTQRHVRLFTNVKISGTQKYKIGNDYVHVPVEYEEYLSEHYGQNWRIPNPNWVSDSDPDCTLLGDSELATYEDCV